MYMGTTEQTVSPSTIQVGIIFATKIVQIEIQKSMQLSDLFSFVSSTFYLITRQDIYTYFL